MKYINFLILVIIILMISCKNEKTVNKKTTHTTQNASTLIIIEKFSFKDITKGKINWILNSKKAIINNEKKIITLSGVNINFKNYYTISSEKGEYLINKKIAHLYKNVKIFKDNVTFLTDNLTFYSNQNKIISNTKIQIFDKKFYLSANSLVGYINKNKFILKGKVKSIIR